MYENSTEMKIWKSVSPVLLYLFINMLVQTGFTIFVTMRKFMALGEGDVISYFSTFNFSGDIERVVRENGLAVTLISGLITVPVTLRMMKRDADAIEYMTVKARLKRIRFKGWYLVAMLGIFASMGISKAVTILPIDNIWGSYAEVENSFEANPPALQLISLVLIGPLTEEIIFRGLVYNRVKSYTDNIKGVYISAAVFGIYHLNLVQGIYGFALGILLCYVYDKYRTILMPVLMHIIANLTALLMSYSGVSKAISGNIFLKLLFMALELAALVPVLRRISNNEKAERNKDRKQGI